MNISTILTVIGIPSVVAALTLLFRMFAMLKTTTLERTLLYQHNKMAIYSLQQSLFILFFTVAGGYIWGQIFSLYHYSSWWLRLNAKMAVPFVHGMTGSFLIALVLVVIKELIGYYKNFPVRSSRFYIKTKSAEGDGPEEEKLYIHGITADGYVLLTTDRIIDSAEGYRILKSKDSLLNERIYSDDKK